MITILCYGDSLTWGYDPATQARLPLRDRWPQVMAECLGPGYHVIAEGLSGRTTVFEDPCWEHRSGQSYLPPCLGSHAPLDLVIIMLGTNDCKHRFGVSASDIAFGAGHLVQIVLQSGDGPDGRPPSVLLVAPPPLGREDADPGGFQDGLEKSRQLAGYYEKAAQANGCDYFDAGTVAATSAVDGVHLDAEEQHKLGAALAAFIGQRMR